MRMCEKNICRVDARDTPMVVSVNIYVVTVYTRQLLQSTVGCGAICSIVIDGYVHNLTWYVNIEGIKHKQLYEQRNLLYYVKSITKLDIDNIQRLKVQNKISLRM